MTVHCCRATPFVWQFLFTQLCLLLVIAGCGPKRLTSQPDKESDAQVAKLIAKVNGDRIEVYRAGGTSNAKPIVVQNAKPDFRPYLHPIIAPDGKGELTEFSPGHHKHQTGLFWGFTRVNGRDYYHHPGDGYFKKRSARVVKASGATVSWEVVYDLMDKKGRAVLTETQTWTLRDDGDQYVMDLHWSGRANRDVTIGKYNYGGLFLRMPWRRGIKGAVINSDGHKNKRAEGKRAKWVDVGMGVPGRDDLAHIVMMDYPDNPDYPQHWRVDGQLGAGPIRARQGEWTIDKGTTASFRHRILVYTGDWDSGRIKRVWKEHIKTAETDENKRPLIPYLTPQQAVDKMTYPDEFEVSVFAGEPDIAQPIAFCFDARGRIWVVENLNYRTRKHHTTDKNTRLVILEDTDGDGKFDSKKIFTDQLTFSSAIAVGFGGVWVGTPPNLIFIPDADGDDIPDGEPQILLEGWGHHDRHETLNSLLWGPDGWLYGCHGVFTRSNVKKPGEKTGAPLNGGIWRYHPTKKKFEVFAHGLSNPWGLDFNKHGQMFATACVIPHLWHVIQGGVYHRQSGRHFNPHVYDDIKTIRDHKHMSAHGGARFYQAKAFPSRYHDRLFMCNIHQHQVLTDVVEPKGSGYVGKHGDDFLSAHDKQWIGFSVEIGPEGAVYILDWHDEDICGKTTHHANTGRVYRIMTKNAKRISPPNLRKLSDAKLVDLQMNDNIWYVRQARTLLQSRAAAGKLNGSVHRTLRNMFGKQTTSPKRLRALWALHVTGGTSAESLTGLLSHADPYVRAWSVQLLCEDGTPSATALAKMKSMAADDDSAVVRLYLASALQRIEPKARWGIIGELVKHEEDADDHNIPKMIWYGLEPIVKLDIKQALGVAAKSKIPMIRRYVARRLISDEGAYQLEANDRDIKKWIKTIRRVAPGFSINAVGKRGVRYHGSFRNRVAVQTHPVNRNKPCVLKRKVSIPLGKRTTLLLRVSHHPHGDWQLVVKANNRVLLNKIIGPKSVKNEWADFAVDLSGFAGKSIQLKLENKANDWNNEWAYWHKVKIVSQ